MQIDTPITIDGLIQYISVSYHRNRSPQKSQWTILINEEVECFTKSHTQKWLLKEFGWGLVIDNLQKLKVLGINSHGEESKIAKFVKNNGRDMWHGYPADLKRRTQDIPAISILKIWRQEGIIKKHHMGKLSRGIVCNL